MNKEELEKIPFRFASHLTMSDQYQTMYVDDSGRLAVCDITERINEFETGKVRREYRIDSKWYKTKAGFERAMQRFEYKKGGEQ